MKKRMMAILMVSVMAVSLLAGCGGGGATSETSEPSGTSEAETETAESGEGGQTVEFWTGWTEGSSHAEESLKMLAKWEEKTGNKVNQTNFTYDTLHAKILTAAAGGNVPDVIWGLPEYIGEFYNMGIIEDLTESFEQWEGKDDLSEAVVDAMTIDGKIVGFPYEMTVRANLVHDDIYEAAGAEVPRTWEDLLAMTNFKEETGTYPAQIAGVGVRSPQELLVYLAQYDLKIATEQPDGKFRNTWNENSEELAKATKVFQFYKDMIDKGVIDPNCRT